MYFSDKLGVENTPLLALLKIALGPHSFLSRCASKIVDIRWSSSIHLVNSPKATGVNEGHSLSVNATEEHSMGTRRSQAYL